MSKINYWKRKDFVENSRIGIQKCYVSVLYGGWCVTLPTLPSGLGFQAKPSLPEEVHCHISKGKGLSREDPNAQKRPRETIHKLPSGNAIALPNQRSCFLSQFLFYILFLLKI